ncbi:MAG: ATP-binding cassette domain-containing protein [Methanothrix sp.]|nr:ATP-binding cassette domain-containing protein [Methanothrix sp.]
MIRLENVFLTLGDSPILKDISFSIEKGETGVMLGASGSGKTTILRIILGLYRPDSGRVFVNGEDITGLGEEELYKVRKKMGMVFQGGALFDSLTVGENVGYRLKESGMDDDDIEACVRKSLRFVGLEDSIDQMPAELSGGMKKRVAIARGIASSPKILLYDEPTAGLDPINAHNITMLINKLKVEEGVASVVVTHDIPAAFSVASKIAFIDEGNLVYVGDKDGLTTSGDERVRKFLNHSGFLTGNQVNECRP